MVNQDALHLSLASMQGTQLKKIRTVPAWRYVSAESRCDCHSPTLNANDIYNMLDLLCLLTIDEEQ